MDRRRPDSDRVDGRSRGQDRGDQMNPGPDSVDRRSPDSDHTDRKTLVFGFGPCEPKDFGTRLFGPLNPVEAKEVQQQLGARKIKIA